MSVTLEKPHSGPVVANSGMGGRVTRIAGRPVGRLRRTVPGRGIVLRFSAGSRIRRVTVVSGVAGLGASSLVRMRDGSSFVVRSFISPERVADAWEYRARSAGVYLGRRVVYRSA